MLADRVAGGVLVLGVVLVPSLFLCHQSMTLAAPDETVVSGRSTAEQRQQVIEAMKEAFGENQKQITHALRVTGCAERLLKVSDLNADPLTVTVAAILHDIGRCKSGTTDHEKDGAIVSKQILTTLGFDATFTDHISRIVGSHHSAKGIDTPECRIVWIADRLVNQKRDHQDQEKLKQEYAKEAEVLDQKIAASKAEAGHQHVHLPPIECPLRKAGIDPHGLKPFEEVEKYIAFLERPDRAQWQKPDDVVKAVKLQGDEVLVDLGAGSGYFSFRFARLLPKGRVYALDTQAEMVRHVHHKAMGEGVSNVQAQLIEPDDPALPSGADIVFVCDVLHHVPDRAGGLKKLHAQMPSGAKLVIIEFKSGKLPQGPPESVKIAKEEISRLCNEAGFKLKEDQPGLLPYQEFLVFERP